MTDFSISRSITIAAPASEVFAHLQDLHRWEAWSPWQELDPNMTQTYSGADAGVGAVMEWEGDKNADAGRMTVVTADPELVEIDIAFIKPFKTTNRSHFALSETDNNTTVTWTMTGKQNLLMKVMFKVMKMEKSIGADFERGLSRLKTVVEAA